MKIPHNGYCFFWFYCYFAPGYLNIMKAILSEKNIVIALFVAVLITFSLAQEDTRKMGKVYNGESFIKSSHILLVQHTQQNKTLQKAE